VTLLKEIEFVLGDGVGRSQAPAGRKVYALSLGENSELTLAPSATSPIRATLPIDDTDFKETIGAAYDAWTTQMVAKARARHEHQIAQRDRIARLEASGDISALEGAGDRPVQEEDGKVPLMLESMFNGDVTEISPEIIEEWGPIVQEEIDGEPYWTATVSYSAMTLFGKIQSEAQALMRHGKVRKWIYTGSGEVVP
jgi:hypothetical protein